MRLPEKYDLEPMLEAIVSLEWSSEHPAEAMKELQAMVRVLHREELSDEDAFQLLGYFIERRLIRSQVHADATRPTGWRPGLALGRRAKYVRVPPIERRT